VGVPRLIAAGEDIDQARSSVDIAAFLRGDKFAREVPRETVEWLTTRKPVLRRLRLAGSPDTPTYSSWLNQMEPWFSKIERDVIARGIFTSVADLRRKLMRYIKHYNKTANPFRLVLR
jgi:hypothetical protein